MEASNEWICFLLNYSIKGYRMAPNPPESDRKKEKLILEEREAEKGRIDAVLMVELIMLF